MLSNHLNFFPLKNSLQWQSVLVKEFVKRLSLLPPLQTVNSMREHCLMMCLCLVAQTWHHMGTMNIFWVTNQLLFKKFTFKTRTAKHWFLKMKPRWRPGLESRETKRSVVTWAFKWWNWGRGDAPLGDRTEGRESVMAQSWKLKLALKINAGETRALK